MRNETTINYQKMPSHNGRFGASGGLSRPTVCAGFQAFAPVRVAVETPACVKPPLRYLSFWDSEVRFGSEKKQKNEIENYSEKSCNFAKK